MTSKAPHAAEEVARVDEKRGDLPTDGGRLPGGPKNDADDDFAEMRDVRQGLHQRHIQMIALAGTIGTGLFLGSGRAIASSGPLGAFLGYTIVGSALAPVVMAVAEMGALVPLSGGIVRYAEYFVDPSLAFADGWNRVYVNCVGIPTELTAAAVLMQFWITVSSAVWITVFGLLTLLVAILFVRFYGELEFTFATLKILLIIGINLMALVVTCGGGPSHETIGFRYWRHPGPLTQYLGVPGALGRFLGVWSALHNALFAFGGIETITIAAAETKNPRTAIPQAAKRIFWRVTIFYVLTIFMVGLIIPYNDPHLKASTGTATQSPFVLVATRSGIKVVPHIINAIVLTSAWSSGNSSILGGSRVLYGLANHGHAPKVFLRVSRFGIPWAAVALILLFIPLGYMTLSHSASTVFNWLQDLVSISLVVNWIIICITYLRFFYGCRAQGIDRSRELPWAAPFQPYATWCSLVLFTLLLLTGGYTTFMKRHWDTETFFASYFNIPFILVLYLGHKLWKRTGIVPLDKVPIRKFIRIYEAEPVPVVKKRRGIQRFNFLWG